MKKITLLVLFAVISLCSITETWASTLYLTTTSGGTQINIHKWGGADATSWPGSVIVASAIKFDVGTGAFYSHSLTSSNYLLHNNAGSQTGNLSITEDTWGQYNGTNVFTELMKTSTMSNTDKVQFASGGYSGGWGTKVSSTLASGTFSLTAPYTSGNGFDIYINGTKFLYVATASISGYSADYSGTSVKVTFNPITGALSMAAAAVPTITSVSSSLPTSSTTQTYKGATITVTGTNLGSISTVKLGGSGGTTITGASIGSTQITFTVPDATSAGTVYVSDGTNNATSSGSLTNLGFISTAATDWNTGSTWLGGAVPAASSSVTVANNITLNSAATNNPTNITINASSGITFGASGAVSVSGTLTNSGSVVMNSGGTLTMANGSTLANGSSTFTGGTGTVAFAGTGTITGTIGFNNVTLAGGVTFSSASTINGTLQINTGGYVNTTAPTYASGSILKYNSGTAYGRGTEWSTTTGAGYPYHVQISNSTTVDMGANSGAAVARQCAGNLTVDAGSTFSMNETGNLMTAAVTVMGNVVNNGTITLSGSSGGDLKSQGNINDNGTFNANSRAVFFNGSATQVIQGTGTFDISYVRINKTGGSVQLATNLTCAGPGGGNAMEIDGTNSILDLNGYTLYLGQTSVSSTYNNGIVTPGSIKGSSTSSISILGNGALGTLNFTSGSQILNNLTIDRQSTGTVTLGSPLTVGGQLTLTNGTFTNSTNLTLGNGATVVRSAGTLSAVPTFGTSVNLTYSGSATKGYEFPATDIINTLTANNTAGITLTDNRNIPNLSIGSGSSLTVNPGKQLSVSTSMSNSGTLNLRSTSTDGTATILTPASISGSGTTNVEQFLKGGRNWYISSPLSDAVSSTIVTAIATTTAGYGLQSYIESSATWENAGTTLVAKKGYVAKTLASDITLNFSGGTLNTGTQSIPLNRTDSAITKRGFNLVGNPYPSYLNWELASRTLVNPTMWYRAKNSGGSYIFDTYGAVSKIGTSLNGTAVTAYIPPMQAFWVRVTGGGTGTLTFENSMRAHEVGTNRIKAPAFNSQQVVRLQVSNGTNSDEAVVLYNANASNGYDDYDSPKMTNNDVAIPEIYTIAGTEQVVINGLNSVTLDEQMPLGFTTGSTNTFTIKATELSNFDADKRLILLDTQENTYQDLTFGSTYTFSSTPTTSSTRFKIVFKSAGVIAGLNNNANNSVIISTNENKQILINRGTELNNDGIVTVYNAVGQKLVSSTLSNSHNILSKPFNSGVYVVCVNIAGINTTKKVIIK